MRKLVPVLFLASTLAGAAPAAAITFSGGFTVSTPSDPGLVVQADPVGSGSINFQLNSVGQSTGWVDLFEIWTDECCVNGDDLSPQAVGVTFNFSQPAPPFAGTLPGQTVGHSSILGLVQWGGVTWSNSLPLYFGSGNTGKLMVYLSDESFNLGAFGLNEGQKNGAVVQANFVLEATPVPVPPALALFAGGLAALGVLARKRKHRRQQQATG